MKKLRHIIITIAVGATLLSGLALQGMGATSLASAASSHHVSTPAVAGTVVFIRPPCGPGGSDC